MLSAFINVPWRNSSTWLTAFALPVFASIPFAAGAELRPTPGAEQVCPDAPISIRFRGPPTVGKIGMIRVFDARDGRAAAAIDVSVPIAVQTIGGIPDFSYRPIVVAGTSARLYFPNHALDYNHTYYVTIDPGTFRIDGEPDPGIAGAASWRFATRAAPPPQGARQLTVAADGSGDFCTVQAALDFVPTGNLRPTTIFLKAGTYSEIVAFADKHDLTVIGEDRKLSVISYANNAVFNSAGGNPYAGGASPNAGRTGRRGIYHRAVFLADRADRLVLANLTIRNTTPHGGKQAEAVILNGSATARAVLRDVDLSSYQDTLQINGQAYLENCFIEGDVDFLWGTGPCFFENCDCRELGSNAYYTQVRNPAANHGFTFLRCRFSGLPGASGNFISRIEPVRFPQSEVVLLDCQLGPNVGAAGWLLQGLPPSTPTPTTIHFWEYHSRDERGNPVDTDHRLTGSRQLQTAADAQIIADYSDPSYVLGSSWDARTASRMVRAQP